MNFTLKITRFFKTSEHRIQPWIFWWNTLVIGSIWRCLHETKPFISVLTPPKIKPMSHICFQRLFQWVYLGRNYRTWRGFSIIFASKLIVIVSGYSLFNQVFLTSDQIFKRHPPSNYTCLLSYDKLYCFKSNS